MWDTTVLDLSSFGHRLRQETPRKGGCGFKLQVQQMIGSDKPLEIIGAAVAAGAVGKWEAFFAFQLFNSPIWRFRFGASGGGIL
jgi:hypothetical protein